MKKIFAVLTAVLVLSLAACEYACAEPLVCITKYGEKYHNRNCRTLARSKYVYEISVADAQNRGYLPCKVCKPLRSVQNKISEQKNIKSYKAVCIDVIDGDTVTVCTKNNEEQKIRLYGIDCPENGQLFGIQAKNAVKDLILNKEISIHAQDLDKYGRTVALVFYNDVSVQKELLKKGLTWVYPTYCKLALCDEFYSLEKQAREDKIGLWKHSGIAPWEWRRM